MPADPIGMPSRHIRQDNGSAARATSSSSPSSASPSPSSSSSSSSSSPPAAVASSLARARSRFGDPLAFVQQYRHDDEAERAELIDGLLAPHASVQPKHFYDVLGSRLF